MRMAIELVYLFLVYTREFLLLIIAMENFHCPSKRFGQCTIQNA